MEAALAVAAPAVFTEEQSTLIESFGGCTVLRHVETNTSSPPGSAR